MSYSILIIEDDPQFKKLLELKLKSFLPNMSVDHFASINLARKFLTENRGKQYDLVVLDQHLPDGEGLALLKEGHFENIAVLAVSSDDNPEMPGENLKAGAAFFLSKTQITQPLVKPLVLGIIDRNRLLRELQDVRINVAVMESIKTLASTLRHEINNPLGAVLGGAFLLKSLPNVTEEQKQAAELVEESGRRIKHVLEQIIEASSLEAVSKANVTVFQIPGDKAWDDGSDK